MPHLKEQKTSDGKPSDCATGIAHRHNIVNIYKRMRRAKGINNSIATGPSPSGDFPEEVKDKEKARRKQQRWK